MPKSCVVGKCSRNCLKNPEVNFLRFPKKDVQTRREWIRFVNHTRSDFRLTEWSLLCSAHFAESCTSDSSVLKTQFGLKSQFRLKKGSVPSLKSPFPHVPSPGRDSAAKDGGRRRRSGEAFRKRERARVLLEAEQGYDDQYCCDHITSDSESTLSAHSHPDSTPDLLMDKSTTFEVQDPPGKRCKIHLNVFKDNFIPTKPPKLHHVRSVRSQTDPRKFWSKQYVQTKPDNVSKQTQCELVKLPPLTKIKAVAPDQPSATDVAQVGRPEGTEGLVVEDETANKLRKRKDDKKAKRKKLAEENKMAAKREKKKKDKKEQKKKDKKEKKRKAKEEEKKEVRKNRKKKCKKIVKNELEKNGQKKEANEKNQNLNNEEKNELGNNGQKEKQIKIN